MRWFGPPAIMLAEFSTYGGQALLYRDNSTQYREVQATSGPDRTPTILAICGDPIICRALVLLLRGPDYDVRYLPAASLSVAGSLAGVQVLLLALERATECRKTILGLLDSATEAVDVHILELTAGLGGEPERRQEPAREQSMIPWPCSTEQLKQHIGTALASRLLVEETV